MSWIWKNLIRPAIFRLDAETAHEIGIRALRSGIGPRIIGVGDTPERATEVFGTIERFGLRFKNPLGVAAGFDKNGMVVNQLAGLGFGFVEVGTVTFDPQKGNPKPRLFRLPADNALINRLGFNNEGAETITSRLKELTPNCIVGVNIGKNKDVPIEEATENYLKSFDLVHPVADYVAINISSPNTLNLRELQKADALDELLKALQERNKILCSTRGPADSRKKPPEGGTQSLPLLVKIAPDLSESEIEAMVDVCMRLGISGIIATNTTIRRDGLTTKNVDRFGEGGLSGTPLAARSNEVIAAIYRFSKAKLPIVGVGGIFTPEDAFAKIAAGACLLQAYTGFVYGGPTFATEINSGLPRILEAKGFARLDEAVGTAVN